MKEENRKHIVIYFFLFNILIVLLFSLIQVYQRYIDLNASIVNGVELAVKDGILLSDLRGSVRDIADSYYKSQIMRSSYLFSKKNNVSISRQSSEICNNNNYIFNYEFKIDKNLFLGISHSKNDGYFFCFNNVFHSNTIDGIKEIAYWKTGFIIDKASLYSYTGHVSIISILIIILSSIILNYQLKRIEKSRKKELTFELAKKVEHEIIKPVSKIQQTIELLLNKNLYSSNKDLSEKLFKIKMHAKDHKAFVEKMFLFALNKENLDLKSNNVLIKNIIDTCFNIELKEYISKIEILKNIPDFFDENFIVIDELYFATVISNIFANAYQAVYREKKNYNSKLEYLKLEINVEIESDLTFIKIKNYGSYLPEDKYEKIFQSGFSSKNNLSSGYGLPYVKDIISIYQGKISVKSEYVKNNIDMSWVEFTIKIPIKYEKIKEINNKKPIFNSNENKMSYEFEDKRVIIVDDDLGVLNYFKDIASSVKDIDYFLDFESAIRSIDNKIYDLAIIDLKFDKDEYAGLNIVSEILKRNNNTYIVIHSSSFFEDKKNYGVRIDEYIQKTMSIEKFLELMSKKDEPQNEVLSINEDKNLYTIAIIDDEPETYQSWKEINLNVNILLFDSFDSFFDYLDLNELNVKSLNAVFTDFYFDKITQGMTVLTSDNIGDLKDIYGFTGPIILVSNASFKDTEKLFDSIISKYPIDIIHYLKNLIK
jgi:signal transduction histidine kinase